VISLIVLRDRTVEELRLPYHLVEVWGNLLSVSKSRLGAAKMKTSILSLVLLTALTFSSVVQSQAATPTRCSTCGVPGPIAGAGVPILAIGFGAYWLAKRLRRRGVGTKESALQVEQKNG
jgi:uncharacterized membrane protein